MAALDFPSSPTVGQVYTANGKSWKWNGSFWTPASSLWSAYSISATEPITYDAETATIGLDPIDGGSA